MAPTRAVSGKGEIVLWPFEETLTRMSAYLPPALIPATARARIATLGSLLPDAFSSYYLECRLAREASQVDLLACVVAADGGREAFTRAMCTGGLERLASDPSSVWSRVRNVFVTWEQPSSILSEQIPHIWLEFDLDMSACGNVAAPNLLFCLEPGYFRRASLASSTPFALDRYQQIIDAIEAQLLSSPLPQSTRGHLLSCLTCLPTGGRILHVSVMVARQPVLFKLNITVPRHCLLAYLQQIGWTGAYDELTQTLEKICSAAECIKFQVVVGEMLGPQLDVEFHYDAALRGEPSPQEVLDAMVTAGVCTPEKRDPLLQWPGTFRTTFAAHSWPTRFYKWMDCKLVARPQQLLEAKGYLGFMPSTSIF